MRAQTFIIGVALIVGVALWWAFSPLLFDTEVNDAVPDIRSESDSNISTSTTPATNTTATSSSTRTESTSTVTGSSRAHRTRFPIEDTPGHPARGYVRVFETPEEQIIRYEDYEGTNGPDLYIYLAKDLDAEEFVNLGLARGNKGNINYGVPLDINIDEYTYVLTWCRALGVLFDYAKIN